MKKLLAVYNICEIAGRSNTAYYIDSIRSLLYQTLSERFQDDYKVVISGCMVTDQTKHGLHSCFGEHVSFNWVEENLPLSVTFNDSVFQSIRRFGEFEGYLYIDSGITFWDAEPVRTCPHCTQTFPGYTGVEALWKAFKETGNSVCAGFPSNDDGGSWWGLNFQPTANHRIPIPKTTNMHVQIFPEEWRAAYGHILPDIISSNTMESLFPFMAAAIKKMYVMTTKIHVQHLHSLDGASIGSREPDPDKIRCSEAFDTPGLMFKTKKNMDEKYKEGREFGFGYEGCTPYWPHDPSKFGEDGFALDDRLLPFLRKEMFLTKEEFDYSKIRRIWVPGR